MLTENNAFLQVVVGNVFKYQGPICYQMLNGLHPARNTHALQAQAWKHTCICRLLLLFYTICITTQTHDPKKKFPLNEKNDLRGHQISPGTQGLRVKF